MRRCWVLLVVLALLAAGPLTVPFGAGCNRCPPECPMHAGKLRCHQAKSTAKHAEPPASGCSLRSSCGHRATMSLARLLEAVLPPAVTAPAVVASRAVRPHVALVVTPLPSDPPTGPPRHLVV